MSYNVFAASVIPVAVRAQAQSSPKQASGASTNGGDAGLSEIVVTAQRRSEARQKVPMAITAITPETAATLNITDVSRYWGQGDCIRTDCQGILRAGR